MCDVTPPLPGSLAHLYQAMKKRFIAQGLATPDLDARILICHGLRITHEDFILQSARVLSEEDLATIGALARQRLASMPIAKIVGYKEFYGRNFTTSQNTLDPRPDSETLITAVLGSVQDKEKHYRILDLGTGTGCLLLTLLHELPQSNGVGADLSPEALATARENALRHGLAGCADFVQSDWFAHIDGCFDIILCNPPYIPLRDKDSLAPDVRDHDPALALYGGADGLEAYRHIIPRMAHFMSPGGLAVFEMGAGQAISVTNLMKENDFIDLRLWPDLTGIDRAVSGNACNFTKTC